MGPVMTLYSRSRMRKPRRQPQTKIERQRFVTVRQRTVALELVVDFADPVSVLDASQAARRLVELLGVTAEGFESPSGPVEVSVRSAEFKRILRISV